MNTIWRFHKLTNLTVFAVLLKAAPMGCRDAVLPKPIIKNQLILCPTFKEVAGQPYNDNLCPLRALALHLQWNQRLQEEALKFFKLFNNKIDGLSADQIQGVQINDVHFVEDLVTLSTLFHVIDFVDWHIFGKLGARNVQKYKNTVRLLRYNNRVCYMSNINAVLHSFRCSDCDTFLKKLSIWSDVLIQVVNNWKMSILGTHIMFEKLSLTSWTLLVLSSRVNQNSWKNC